jgi:transcriptional regulator with AAA-type ATPase domain
MHPEAVGPYWVESLQIALRPSSPDFRAALDAVAGHLGALGAALGEWPGGGNPRILATYGDLGPHMEHPRIFDFFGKVFLAGAEEPFLQWGRPRTLDDHFCCGLRRPGAELLACVLRSPRGADRHIAERICALLRGVDQVRELLSGPLGKLGQPRGTLALPLTILKCGSGRMRSIYEQIEALRDAEFPVLFAGETGCGKEHLVRLLHEVSPRRQGAFVAVNCAAIPADLLEAEMFGVKRGAATGVAERPGRFREANRGTLFLDEIGDMPLPLQAKLLRVLESHEVAPLGGRSERLEVRVISATNAPLEDRVRAGVFRADLYHRVGGFTVDVPALRERRADIPPLLTMFLGRFATARGEPAPVLSPKALELLTNYSWPGNVRELENEARRLVYLCGAARNITESMLSPRIQRAERTQRRPPHGDSESPRPTLSSRLADLERRAITEALDRCGGQQNKAADLLGLSRNGLAKKMRRLGIRVAGRAVTFPVVSDERVS